MENKEKNSRKTGRPAKGGDKLITSINLKLTSKDYNSVKQKAGELGMTPTQFARELTLEGSIKSRYTLEQLDLMRKLSGMANNLNQITKQANKLGFSLVSVEIAHIAVQIKELLDDC